MIRPAILVITDGIGYREDAEGNAFAQAEKPEWERILTNHPYAFLNAGGLSVGLPENQMGNSEVGHLTIGSGRIIYQDLVKINKSIESGSFFRNEVLKEAMHNAKGNKLHLMGLLSDGGVHSHINHLKALIEFAKKENVENVCIHAFLDGRDTPPTSGINYLREIDDFIKDEGIGKISTIIGRFYAMDRDKRWDRIKIAYDMLTSGIGNKIENYADVNVFYKNDITDEFMKPLIIDDKCLIENGDSVIFYNFRSDRAREITSVFTDNSFSVFERNRVNIHFSTFTEYSDKFQLPAAFKKDEINNVLAEVLSKKGLRQLHIAETEKYAHVTFFFNGGREEPFQGEDRVIVPSPKVDTYDKTPEMSAHKITERVLHELKEDKYDFIVINYANGDMVGHTAVKDACIKAVECVDSCLGRLYDSIMDKNGVMIITADHGNIEQIEDDNGNPVTSHTTNPVYCIIAGGGIKKIHSGGLKDIAPTILNVMDITLPPEMTGSTLIDG